MEVYERFYEIIDPFTKATSMQLSNSKLTLAPTDFSKHLSCKYLTAQNLQVLVTGVKPPFISIPVLETLQGIHPRLINWK